MPPLLRPVRSKYPSIPDLIVAVRRAWNWSEAQLGEEIGVTQPTISRWFSDDAKPTAKHLEALERLFDAALMRLGDAKLAYKSFQYVCSFAPRYTQELFMGANEALRIALQSTGGPLAVPSLPGIALDVFIRAAVLPPDVRAHTFVDSRETPRIFIVLVNANLTTEQQYRTAWDEAIAHVMKRLGEHASPVHPPKSIFGQSNHGRSL